jgi:predicted flap endonuclease-1-like 5' DNA nuclease
VSPEGLNITTTPYALTSSGTTPSFLPISHFLGDTLTPAFGETAGFTYDLKDIPGINESIQSELLELGYTSVEQIARWGRADVRAVSALLEVDQNKIEEEWVAGARFILSIR